MAQPILDIQVEGLDDLIFAMSNLPDAITQKALLYALRQGANLIAKDAKRRVSPHSKSGNLASRIAVRKRKKIPAGAAAMYSVGVLGGASGTYANTRANRRKRLVGQKYERGGTAYYWRYLEFGTRHQKATPFLRPAFDSQGVAAIQLIGATSSIGFAKAVAYAKRKGQL